MCSPSTPTPQVTEAAEPVATPTYADAKVQKAGENTRQQKTALVNKNIKSTALGVTEEAETKKKTLLGE